MNPPLLTLAFLLAAASLPAADAAEADFFESQIRPLLFDRCYECHSGSNSKGGLTLDTREGWQKGGDSGPAIVPGKPDESLLIKAIRYTDPDTAMPPKKKGGKLSDAQITALTEWVKMGAPDPRVGGAKIGGMKAEDVAKWWAFQPLPLRKEAGDSAKIDALISEKRTAAGKTATPRADARTLVRRATYDLTGLPPTAEEIAAFEQESARDSAGAYRTLVERLLASPHYGERWGRHWLDVVRYADTAGETADYPAPLAWRYRNYVIESFNADKPYNEFIREQIAGDVLAERGPREKYAERATASGYLAISRRFGFDSENYHNLTIQDTIDTMGQSVLGLTLGCARCHDHKFDPVTMRDYYALYGIFDSSRYAFPGSEQKQKARSVTPLQPIAESVKKWREFDERIAILANHLAQEKQGVPSGVLRSMHDGDGDLEMQAAASGGSKGVLVPPWITEGSIDVAAAAQSPFRNVYPAGKVGAHIVGGVRDYAIVRGVNPQRTAANCAELHVNLDFRLAPPAPNAQGAHRIRLGTSAGAPALMLTLSSSTLSLPGVAEPVALKPGEWHNLQLTLNLRSRTFSGRLATNAGTTPLPAGPLAADWAGTLDRFTVDSLRGKDGQVPALDVDNFAAQDFPLRPAVTALPPLALATSSGDEPALSPEMKRIVEMDSGFDFQTDSTPPAAPWHAGPNSVVKITVGSQSTFRNLLPIGGFGIHMPNRGEYDGFGQTLADVGPDKDGRLFVSFDFRCASAGAGGEGSWRYYLGNGPGNSAAVELFFNATHFSPRNGDTREPLCALTVGTWYQVQLALDTKAKTYSGILASVTGRTAFTGKFAGGWNGKIDYTFIDSYGHRGGIRPSLDADNFIIRDTTLPAADVIAADNTGAFREAAERIRKRAMIARERLDNARKELETLLIEGPEPVTYGMAEGTPHNARIQLRGEADRPGDEVPRGFIASLGGAPLPTDVEGSGRLELANWLVMHPLTARVMANRIWQFHFGRGLVTTPNDFGARGQAPTHPALLEFLASEFVHRGWSIKEMHRLIMLSGTYQQTAGEAGDYAGFARRRLTAEELRDSILAVSGTLDREPGRVHPFPSPLGWGYTQHGPFNAVYDHDKRSVYLMVQRIKRHPFLALFDGADPNATTAERRITTVPTQALYFLNDPFVHDKAAKLADRLTTSHKDGHTRIEAAHLAVLGRKPVADDIADATAFLAAAGTELGDEAKALASYVRTLIGGNEFLHID